MLQVGIKQYRLWTFIGMYPEERKIPNQLTVSIEVTINHPDKDTFIDYTLLHQILKNNCTIFHEKIETLIQDIQHDIKQICSYDTLVIEIEKSPPPTGTNVQSSYVKYTDYTK